MPLNLNRKCHSLRGALLRKIGNTWIPPYLINTKWLCGFRPNTIHNGTANHCSQNLSCYVEKGSEDTYLAAGPGGPVWWQDSDGHRWCDLYIYWANVATTKPNANATFISWSGWESSVCPIAADRPMKTKKIIPRDSARTGIQNAHILNSDMTAQIMSASRSTKRFWTVFEWYIQTVAQAEIWFHHLHNWKHQWVSDIHQHSSSVWL